MTPATIPIRCPACRDSVSTQRDTYVYARSYLCAYHQTLWDGHDERAHAQQRCPHAPKLCGRCEPLREDRKSVV